MIQSDLKKRIYTSFFLILLLILIFSYSSILILSLLILGIFSIIEFFSITAKIIKNSFYYFLFNLIFIFYIFGFCYTFFIFSNFIQLKIILFSLLIGCIASDLGGYTFGKIFKGPKLTKISPRKTISGAIGSIFLTIITMSVILYYFTNNFSYMLIIIFVITSVTCQLGDLFFSYLKRKARIKDTGNFLPGHGGVLDRLDGIFLGLPCGYISLWLIY